MHPLQTSIRRQETADEVGRFEYVPELGEVPGIARTIRKAWGATPAGRLDPERICAYLGIEVSVLSLGVPDGGAQGFLIPKATGRFRIEVDPEPRGGWQSVSAGLRRSLERHRKRFLITHELAHTLFYENGPKGPKRLLFDSPEQETFCDEMARALLVPDEIANELPFTPDGVLKIQRRFDVSMEIAMRSLVAAAHTEPGIAWLLLQHPDETLIQWTSADRSLTSRALRTLRTLAVRASRNGRADASLISPNQHASALYLPRREQVIVTCSCTGAS